MFGLNFAPDGDDNGTALAASVRLFEGNYVRVFFLAAILWTFGAAAAGAAPVRIALVIGNSDYATITALRNPTGDARLIQRTLRDQLGFEVIYAENAKKADMERAIAKFGERLAEVGSDAVAIFYYAGHGVQSGGENFLLPIDVTIAREADLTLRSVRAEDVLRQMQGAKTAVKIVILDACRDNPFAASFKMSSGPGLADIALGNTEFTVGYAATAGLQAEDGDGANSPYATALAKYLPTPNKEIFEIFRMVRYDVAEATEGRQLPEARTTMLHALYLNGTPGSGVQVASNDSPKAVAAKTIPTAASLQGRWCQASRSAGPAFFLQITPASLEYVLGDNKVQFGVRKIEPTQTGAVAVHWINKQTPTVLEFGEFSSDGKTMTQIRGRDELGEEWKQYDLRFRRC